MDIEIHEHCNLCINIKHCQRTPKRGNFNCEIITCPHNCDFRFHACKLSEHLLLCSRLRVPCLNAAYGCPHTLPRYTMADHLPHCPASVVVCACERNRWLTDLRAREIIAPRLGYMDGFDVKDLDVSLALHDQALVNQLSLVSPDVALAATSSTNKRYPALPLMSSLTGGARHLFHVHDGGSRSKRSPSVATDDEDLVPGLAVSVCAQLQSRDDTADMWSRYGAITDPYFKAMAPILAKQYMDDLKDDDGNYVNMCSHGINRSHCFMCKNDIPPPPLLFKNVWREEWSAGPDGLKELKWVKGERISKIRRRGPFDQVLFQRVEELDDLPCDLHEDMEGKDATLSYSTNYAGHNYSSASAALTPGKLRVELPFDNYSKHQTKPRNMITIQCLQVLRRSEYANHYQMVHSELLGEGLEGRQLLGRCPLMERGCPYSQLRLTVGAERGEISFSPLLQAFGLKPHLSYEHPLPPDSRPVSPEKGTSASATSALVLPTALTQRCSNTLPSPASSTGQSRSPSPCPLYGSGPRLTRLPTEVLLHILSFLDGFSLSQVALTCEVLSAACAALVLDRGLVLLYWYREDRGPGQQAAPATQPPGARRGTTARARWRVGKPWWVFSSSFGNASGWQVKEGVPSMADHLKTCPYNVRNAPAEKFTYGPLPAAVVARIRAKIEE